MFPQTIFLHLGNMVSVPFLKNLFIGIAQDLNSGSVLYLAILFADDFVLRLLLGGHAVQ